MLHQRGVGSDQCVGGLLTIGEEEVIRSLALKDLRESTKVRSEL
jgi:hypothetical protein